MASKTPTPRKGAEGTMERIRDIYDRHARREAHHLP
jgi:hypothetical protein